MANRKEVSKLSKKIVRFLYKQNKPITFTELRHNFKKYTDESLKEALELAKIYTWIYFRDDGGTIKDISINAVGINHLDKEKASKLQYIVFVLTIIIGISTVIVQWQTSNQTLEQQRDFYGAHLSFWQNRGIQNILANDLVSLDEGHHEISGFCLQNDGQSSTGTISVLQSYTENKFLVYTRSTSSGYYQFVVPNLLPGEGNCTDIYIWYRYCYYDKNIYCNLSLVPKGKQVIQFTRYCALCPEKDRNTTENFTFCVQPSTECV